MGPEVEELEQKLAEFCNAKHCISCGNGTDALQLALLALDIGAGDAVFVPSFTFAASAEAVALVGATPVLVDIDLRSYCMSAESLERTLSFTRSINLRPAAVIPVDLFGQPADYESIFTIASKHEIRVIADSAQGWGATYKGQTTGTLGDVTTTSFFPSKPLGCYGDGGAIFTQDFSLASKLDSLRAHGKASEKYENVRIGTNSRLDTIQAAILLTKLEVFEKELEERDKIASRYSQKIPDQYITPTLPAHVTSTWAQYTLRARTAIERELAQAALKSAGIPTAVYYPRPLHLQTAYANFPQDPAGLKHSEQASATVFSLPMSPYLTLADQDKVIETLSLPA